jgi:acylphosphatase
LVGGKGKPFATNRPFEIDGKAFIMERLHAIVHGRVQGVSFRFNTVLQAQRLGVTGWVRNLPDGTVETTAEGERPVLEEFLSYLHHGPLGAGVTQVQADWLAAEGTYEGFNIR